MESFRKIPSNPSGSTEASTTARSADTDMLIGRLQRTAEIIATRTSVVLLRSLRRLFENLSLRIFTAAFALMREGDVCKYHA
jgi:hypothetical protein